MTREAIERAGRQLASNTTEHRMEVLHDDGVYRHLRFAKPGSWVYGFDIVTWPGHLAVSGDVGDGWSFSRLHDMFEFFGHREVNADYWWEKMPSQLRDRAKHFSEDLFKQIAHEHIEEWPIGKKQRAKAIAKFDEDWDWTPASPEHQREYVAEFKFTDKHGQTHDFGPDTWEWGAEDFDHHFLLALHAIVFGIRKYREYEAAIEAARAPQAAA
ncbi:hypothetical protein [Microbacterium trichothecenolyticum]|uniref:Uncharacterized protein n=1 Tax=Microbacterium trichothecenolyticum TaxID=69370 RepID=A0A0M2HMD0_MICTR|nr:hypothetical protein [Microbacterium trichothecenolyticum]KJL45584.1 hypothetical protein RS82_00136 [Microbacterium trichothecenolyticum]